MNIHYFGLKVKTVGRWLGGSSFACFVSQRVCSKLSIVDEISFHMNNILKTLFKLEPESRQHKFSPLLIVLHSFLYFNCNVLFNNFHILKKLYHK